jgi:hypothetical protein
VDGGELSVQIGTRDRLNDPVAWSTEIAQNAIGGCPTRSAARYHRARLRIAADSTWTHAQGVDVDIRQEGQR